LIEQSIAAPVTIPIQPRRPLDHANGVFQGFYSLNETDRDAAAAQSESPRRGRPPTVTFDAWSASMSAKRQKHTQPQEQPP
jgi:hypothetical protein